MATTEVLRIYIVEHQSNMLSFYNKIHLKKLCICEESVLWIVLSCSVTIFTSSRYVSVKNIKSTGIGQWVQACGGYSYLFTGRIALSCFVAFLWMLSPLALATQWESPLERSEEHSAVATRCQVSVQYSILNASVSPGSSSQSVRVDSSQTCLPHRVLTCFPGGALSNYVLLYVFANNNNERKV